MRLGVLDVRIGFANPFVAGAMFLAAGAYQFSRAKHACLTHCQHPFRFFFANWTSEPAACSASDCGRGFIASAAAGR